MISSGARTLDVLGGTPRINEWMLSRFAEHLQGTVLEVGAGIGNISEHLVPRVERAVLTDVEDVYVERLRERFRGRPNVDVARFDLASEPPDGVRAHRYDAIVAINVLEHVADDRLAVERLVRLLVPGGRLLVYVPACPWAFGRLDVELEHHRRYTRSTLHALLADDARRVGPIRYMNALGLAGWFVNGKVLRRRTLPPRQMKVFEYLLPIVKLEKHLALPLGLGLHTWVERIA
jgi:SAM-dependent methyltransferase